MRSQSEPGSDGNVIVEQCYRAFFPESQGGLEQVILEIAQGIPGCSVLTLSDTPAKALTYHGVQIRACKRWFSVASNCVGFGYILALWQSKAQILHFHYPWPFGDLAYLIAGKGRRFVVTYHSDIVRQKLLGRLYAPLERWFLSRASKIVATSEGYLETSKTLQEYRSKVRVIPLGIDQAAYADPCPVFTKEAWAAYGTDFMLFVGVLRYYKGLDYLVRAAAGCPFKVVIVGKGPEEARLKELAFKLGADNVIFLGFLPDNKKMALMHLCRAIVFPSHLRSEAYGVTLVEGLMCSKPLISCEIGTGTSFVNLDRQTGIVVPPADIEALRHAMFQLWTDKNLALKYGQAARHRYEEYFTGHLMVERYQELYEEVLNMRQR